MVKPAMVRRLVHGNAANAAITCSILEQIAKKICIYQIKVVPLHTVFMNKLRSDALRSDCVGCFVIYFA